MKHLPARLAAALARCERLLSTGSMPRDPRKPRLQLEALDTREVPALITTPASLTATLGQTVSISALAYVTDTNGDPVTISSVYAAGHGSVSSGGTNGVDISYTVTDGSFTGTDSFNYLIDEGQTQSTVGTVYIAVSASSSTMTNTAPTAYGGYATAVAGIPEVITVPSASSSGYAYDADGDSLSVIAVGSPGHGTVGHSGNVITYTADSSFSGMDTFSYTIDDGHGHTATGAIGVGVSINAAPTVYGGYADALAGTTVSIAIPSTSSSAYAYDADGDNITLIAVGTAVHGTAGHSGNTITYAPDTGFTGTDTFSYAITDGHHGHTVTGVFNIGVSASTNVAPTAYAGYATAVSGTPSTIAIPSASSSSYAYDADGDSITLSSVGTPGHGTASLSGNIITYAPDTGFTGTDTFSYSVSDGHGHTVGSNITVGVSASTNVAPTAYVGYATAVAGTPSAVTIPSASSSAFAYDADGDSITVNGVGTPGHGTASLGSNTITYTPDTGFAGTDTFSYAIDDGHGHTVSGNITVGVSAATNVAPTAHAGYATAVAGTPSTITIPSASSSSYAYDADGDSITLSSVGTPGHGTVSQSGNAITYTPDVTFTGTDTFSYSVSDGHGHTVGSNITVGFSANSAPTGLSLDPGSVPENAGANATVGLFSSTDPDSGDTFTYSLVSGAGSADNSAFYLSGDRLLASSSFDYETRNSYGIRVRTTDRGGLYAEQTFTVTVTDVNEDTSVSLEGTGSSTYGDSVTLTATVTPLTNGPGDPSGTVTFKDGSTTLGTGTVSGGVATFSTSALGAGSHSITAVYGGGTGYNGSASSAGTQTVSKAHLTVTAADKTKVYGAANPSLTTTITGFKNGETLATSGVTGSAGASTSATTASHAGDHSITASAGSLAAGNYDFPTLVDGTLTVTKASLTITADDKTKIYGVAVPSLTASYVGFVNGDTSASLATGPALSASATSSSSVAGGPYSITASGAGSYDYTISYVSGSLTVTTATLTVTAANKTKAYGVGLPALTYSASGYVNGDSSGVMTGALTTTATAASNAGSYSITQGTLSAGSNYAISITSGTLTVTKITLSVTTIRNADESGDGGILRFQRVGDVSSKLTVDFKVGGTAALNTDYAHFGVAAPHDNEDDTYDTTVEFGIGVYEINVQVSVTDDRFAEGTETIVVSNLGDALGDNYEPDPGTATMNIADDDHAPVAVNDTYSVHAYAEGVEPGEHKHLVGNEMDNDTDEDDDWLRAVMIADVSHGTLTLYGTGAFDYLPDTGYVGDDSFAYQASDGTNISGIGTVTIHVTNTAAESTADTYGVATDAILNVSAPGVLGNDTDADGDALTAGIIDSPVHGELSLNANGSLTYTPDTGYYGPDSFSYQASDGLTTGDPVEVTLNVHNTNAAPVAATDSATVHARPEGMEPEPRHHAIGHVLGNDTDEDDDPLTAVLLSDVTHGMLTLNTDGSFDYLPDAGYIGSDSFTYKAGDGQADSNTATVTIQVTNDIPVSVSDEYSVAEGATLTVLALQRSESFEFSFSFPA